MILKKSDSEYYRSAVSIVQKEGRVSTSLVQRHLSVSYARAARLVEQMEKEGLISKANHVGIRHVIVHKFSTLDTNDETLYEIIGKIKGDEKYYRAAVSIVQKEGRVSTSLVQRHLSVDYARAARLVEQMEKEGLISKANHVGIRHVIVHGYSHLDMDDGIEYEL